jgi:hypothetical protein
MKYSGYFCHAAAVSRPDQHPQPELEQLMAETDLNYALIDLRPRETSGSWLVGSFLARPSFWSAEEATWSEKFDALFFIRAQEPWRAAAGGQEPLPD